MAQGISRSFRFALNARKGCLSASFMVAGVAAEPRITQSIRRAGKMRPSMQAIEYVLKVAIGAATRIEIKDNLEIVIFKSRVTLSSMPLHQGKNKHETSR
jgi:hypothetical protein